MTVLHRVALSLTAIFSCLLVAVVGPAPADAAQKTKLQVSVSGLPAGVRAAVTVKAPHHRTVRLTGNRSFTAPGSYRVSAKPVAVAGRAAVPQVSRGRVRLTVGHRLVITVRYALPGVPIPPPAPARVQAGVSGLTAPEAFSTGVHLTWTNPVFLPGAEVVVRRGNAQPPATPAAGVEVPLDPSGTGATDDDLAPGTRYAYSVFVVGAQSGTTAPSSIFATTTGGGTDVGTVPATTARLDDGDVSAATSAANAPDGTDRAVVTVAAGVSVPGPGGTLMIPPSDDFPDGMVGVVVSSVHNPDGTTTATIQQGSIGDALPALTIDQTDSFEMDPVFTPDGSAQVAPAARGRAALAFSASAFTCSANGVSKSPADLFDSANPLPITVEFSQYHLNQYFSPGQFWPHVSPALDLGLYGEADITAKFRPLYGEFSCELSPTWRRAHRLFRVRIPVPGVPVPITLNLEFGLKFSVSGEGGVEFHQHRYWGIDVHKWNDDPMGVTMSGSAGETGFAVSDTISADADLFADISLMAGGGYASANAQAGVYGTLGPFVSLKATASTDTGRACLTADVGVKSDIGVRLELWVKRWNLELGSITWAKKNFYNSCDDTDPAAGTNGVTLGSGDVQATLRWDNNDDMDVHVIDPSDEEIYYLHTASASGGQLDHDTIPGCDAPVVGNSNVENIYWPPGGAPSGQYHVSVNEYADCSSVNSLWTLTVKVDGAVVLEKSGYGSSSWFDFDVP